MGCKSKYETSSWHLNGFPDGINIIVTLGQQYNVGEKPAFILCTLTTLIAMQGHQTSKTKQKQCTRKKVHDDQPRQHSFGTTLRFTGPVPADSRQ